MLDRSTMEPKLLVDLIVVLVFLDEMVVGNLVKRGTAFEQGKISPKKVKLWCLNLVGLLFDVLEAL